jgi:hypothetical protein
LHCIWTLFIVWLKYEVHWGVQRWNKVGRDVVKNGMCILYVSETQRWREGSTSGPTNENKVHCPIPWRHTGGVEVYLHVLINPATRWKGVVSCTPRPLYLRERDPVPIG